jgi:hypothetical protein
MNKKVNITINKTSNKSIKVGDEFGVDVSIKNTKHAKGKERNGDGRRKLKRHSKLDAFIIYQTSFNDKVEIFINEQRNFNSKVVSFIAMQSKFNEQLSTKVDNLEVKVNKIQGQVEYIENVLIRNNLK